MALIVLDSSVLIGYLERLDEHHEQASAAVRAHRDDDLRVPASAYAESLVLALRGGRYDETRAVIARIGLTIVPIDERVAEAAARIRSRTAGIRLPDALVIACGEVIEADAVLTADRRWARFPRVEVVGRPG